MLDFNKLNMIRPWLSRRGNCFACAVETAKALISDEKYIPNTINTAPSEDEDLEIFQKMISGHRERHNDAATIFEKIQNSSNGSIFLVDNEDHAYILFKSNIGNIYLLDSDMHLYKQIYSAKDFIFPKGSIFKDRDFNYLDDKEVGYVWIYPLGQANACWDEIELKASYQP